MLEIVDALSLPSSLIDIKYQNNELSVDCRTINSPTTFCDPTYETILIVRARSLRVCWFESTLLQHFCRGAASTAFR